MRLGLLAVCVAAIVVLAGRLGDQDGCQAARQALFAAGVGGTTPPAAQVRALRADCHDVDDLSAGAVSVLLAGEGRDAARLAREATRRGPDVFSAWVALEAVQRRTDPA